MAEEYTASCPTCGRLPVDSGEMARLRAALLRAALKEALDGWGEWAMDALGNRACVDEAERDVERIAELRKEFGL